MFTTIPHAQTSWQGPAAQQPGDRLLLDKDLLPHNQGADLSLARTCCLTTRGHTSPWQGPAAPQPGGRLLLGKDLLPHNQGADFSLARTCCPTTRGQTSPWQGPAAPQPGGRLLLGKDLLPHNQEADFVKNPCPISEKTIEHQCQLPTRHQWILGVNSLAPGTCGSNFKGTIFKLIMQNCTSGTHCARNCFQVNANGPHYWEVNIGLGIIRQQIITWDNVDSDKCPHIRLQWCKWECGAIAGIQHNKTES